MEQQFVNELPRRIALMCLVAAIVLLTSCSRTNKQGVPYVPIEQLERTFGRLITASNVPTPDQHGTGDRIGLFSDESGTVWGIPLTIGENGTVLGCAPPSLRDVPVSDTLPAGTVQIVGAANEPTGWRGGTGELELLLRGWRRSFTLAFGCGGGDKD